MYDDEAERKKFLDGIGEQLAENKDDLQKQGMILQGILDHCDEVLLKKMPADEEAADDLDEGAASVDADTSDADEESAEEQGDEEEESPGEMMADESFLQKRVKKNKGFEGGALTA